MLTRANTVAGGLFSPLLSQLGTARAAAENNARAAYAKQATALENALQRTSAPVAGGFDTAIGQSAKVNEAVANRLANQGTSASSGLAAQLAQISADPNQAAQLAQAYTGAGNAGFAHGAADLSALIGRRGEAVSYQGKLPQIARLMANQALEGALSEQRGYFAQEESDLRRESVNTASQIYQQLRQEGFSREQAIQEAKQATLDRAAEEKASLRALAAASQSDAAKLAYQAQEKALDRQTKIDIANLNAQTRLATDNPPKPDPVTGAANLKFITVNGRKVKNPNYVPPTKAGTSANDSWLTPGSAKRERIVESAWSAVTSPEGGWNSAVLSRLRKFPNSADAIINTAINQALRARGIDPNHPSAKKIRAAIRQRISGRSWKFGEGEDQSTATFTVGK